MAAVAACVLLADQLSKLAIAGGLERGERLTIVGDVFITNVRNEGVAFGLFAGGGAVLIAGTAVATVALLAYFAIEARRRWLWLGMGLVIGGAAGNLVDRFAREGVVDFIKVYAWPTFNLADSAITIGVVLLIWLSLREDPRASEADTAPAGG
ncbi:MAG: signal peptidase II [Solirubrobacterales bacterium]